MGRRGRKPGSPLLKFDPTARDTFLRLVAAGAYIKDAAKAVGVADRTARHAAAIDEAFAALLADAETRGREARQDSVPHGEYRYNHLGCRCDICRKTATLARAGRPDRQPPATPPTPLPVSPPTTEASSFPLARAS